MSTYTPRPKAVKHVFVDGKHVPESEHLDRKLARPPTALCQHIVNSYGIHTAWTFTVIWHHAVIHKFRPFNFGRSKYAAWGIAYRGLKPSLDRLVSAGVIACEQEGLRALRITKVNSEIKGA